MKSSIIAVILLLFYTTNAFMQSNRDSVMTDNIDQVVITAQFSPTDTRETVNSVRVLTKKIIEQRSVLNLQELLQTEPNIRISQDPILGSNISINGLKGENLKILIDGVPIVGRLNGSIDAGQVPLSSIQKIEIIEGAQSLLYGSEASGGVINIITSKSQLSEINAEVNGQYESNGFRNISTKVGYSGKKITAQINGNIQEFIPLPDNKTGRDQLWNPKYQKSGRALLRYQPSEMTDIKLSGNILNERVDNLGEIRRPTFKPYAFDDFYYTDRYDINLHIDHHTKAKNLFQATLGWNNFNRIKNSIRLDFDDQKTSQIEGLQDTSFASGILTRFTFASDKKEKKLNYLIGLENYYETARGTRLYDSLSSTHRNTFTNDLGVFASGKYKFTPKLVLQSGARWTHNNRYGSAVTPSTWLFWQPKLPVQFRFSWAYGYRSPSVKELFFNFVDVNHFVLGNANLVPEKSINLRAEATFNPFKVYKASVSFTSSVFYNKVDDRIILKALGPVHYEYTNVKAWKTKGISLRMNLNITDNVRYQSDLVYTGFFNEDEENIINSSEYMFSPDWANDLNFTFLKGKLNWNIWHKLTGKTPFFYNQDGVTKQGFTDSWNMLNTGISTHVFNKKIRINTGIKNIFNIKQLQTNNANGIHIEASNQQNLHWGRNFYVGICYQWQK